MNPYALKCCFPENVFSAETQAFDTEFSEDSEGTEGFHISEKESEISVSSVISDPSVLKNLSAWVAAALCLRGKKRLGSDMRFR